MVKPITDLDKVAHNGEWTPSNTEIALCGPGEALLGGGFAFMVTGDGEVGAIEQMPLINAEVKGMQGRITSDAEGRRPPRSRRSVSSSRRRSSSSREIPAQAQGEDAPGKAGGALRPSPGALPKPLLTPDPCDGPGPWRPGARPTRPPGPPRRPRRSDPAGAAPAPAPT